MNLSQNTTNKQNKQQKEAAKVSSNRLEGRCFVNKSSNYFRIKQTDGKSSSMWKSKRLNVSQDQQRIWRNQKNKYDYVKNISTSGPPKIPVYENS